MADTNGNGAPRWAWVAKTALGALGTIILVMLVDLRAGQERNGAKADEAIRQVAATRVEVVSLGVTVTDQKQAVEKALDRLHFFRSAADVEWSSVKDRLLRLEMGSKKREVDSEWNRAIEQYRRQEAVP